MSDPLFAFFGGIGPQEMIIFGV
ncbi:MAG: hypothetical protein JWM11_7205, partial [Planctomycetaceae bacterium]|nr:hypothetical protein [Planctomycetaceae bacterium]